MSTLCGNTEMQDLVKQMQSGSGNDLALINTLIETYPEDARLHFMRGSVLVGEGQLIEGHSALSRAIEIAPDFAIARFQLGFFQLTSGEADNALQTWEKLDDLPHTHYLKIFVNGLRLLIQDNFEACIKQLTAGINVNTENEPLNDDMRLIIAKISPLIESNPGQTSDDIVSSTSFLLNQYTGPDTKH